MFYAECLKQKKNTKESKSARIFIESFAELVFVCIVFNCFEYYSVGEYFHAIFKYGYSKYYEINEDAELGFFTLYSDTNNRQPV